MTIDLNAAAKSTQQQSYNPDEAASARIEDKERVGKATTLQEVITSPQSGELDELGAA